MNTLAIPLRLAAVTLTVVLSFAPAQATPPPSTPVPHTPLEVEVDPTIPDAEPLSDWILEDATATLAAITPPPTNPTPLLISVSGALYDYNVSITGPDAPSNTAWHCECTNDELLFQIRAAVEAAARNADREPPADERKRTPLPRVPVADLALEGKIGIGLMAGGGAATLAGIVLIGVGERRKLVAEDWRNKEHKKFWAPGIPTLIVGAASFAAGMALYIIDLKHPRRYERLSRVLPVPQLARDGAGVGITGRF